jgi:hypothetical protein
MNKINLLINQEDFNTFQSMYLTPILSDYFNFLTFDKNTTYDRTNTIIVTNCLNMIPWFKKLEGFKVVVDNLWEQLQPNLIPNSLVISNKNFFWYNECLWYTALGYNKYVPNKTYDKLAFIPMRLRKPHRDQIFNKLTPWLNSCVHSYVGRGIVLPKDIDQSHPEYDRHFNPTWYDSTYFSLVVETTVNDKTDIFITEKSFKPMAFYHPYMIFGQKGILTKLKIMGFETYDNIFDESYDLLVNTDQRATLIMSNIENFKYKKYDRLTLDKLEYNHQRFFDKDFVTKQIIKEIIEPILEYAEA